MKKIALLLCAIVMFGCSDDEEKQAQKFLTRK